MAPGLGMPPGAGMPPPGFGPPGGMPGAGPAPQKTMMLQGSEGIVSVGQRGTPLPPMGSPATGASATFWVVSILVGVAVGALGYIVVLQL